MEIFHRRVAVARGAVVRGDNEYRVLPYSQVLQFLHKGSNLPVDVGDHRCVGGVRVPVRQVHPRSRARLLVPQLVHIVHDLVKRSLHGAVRHGCGPHHEERRGSVVLHELDHFVVHQVAAVMFPSVLGIVVHVVFVQIVRELAALDHELVAGLDFYTILPQFDRVVGVGECLTVEPVEIVEPHSVRKRCAFRESESPFSDHGRFVAG